MGKLDLNENQFFVRAADAGLVPGTLRSLEHYREWALSTAESSSEQPAPKQGETFCCQ